ncbi:MAG: cytochrome c biogenesis protein CcdA, partial [Pseudomonadota bacterium]
MLGLDIIDAALLPALAIALLGGLISFASPCVLPIVPPYLAYMGGVSLSEMSEGARARRKALVAAAFFVLGLSTVFLLLGFTASALGRFFLQGQDWFVVGAGIIVMIFGAHFIGVFRIG